VEQPADEDAVLPARQQHRDHPTKLARYGNPLNGVLAPVHRMSIVASWTTKYMACPAIEMSTSRISSDPYADDEMQSLERTPRAVFLLSRSPFSSTLVSGGPSRRHLIR